MRMSKQQRQEQSERMKQYWANRRQAKSGDVVTRAIQQLKERREQLSAAIESIEKLAA